MQKRILSLVSAPHEPKDFFRSCPFLLGLSKISDVVLLMPAQLEHIRSLLKPRLFEIIIYEKCPKLFSVDYKRIEAQLSEKRFHFLIELNTPANVSLPYLSEVQRRVAFYDKRLFPYYNMLMKDGYNSLIEFFSIESEGTADIFHFHSRDLKSLEKRLGKSHPLLFVNGALDVKWEGQKLIVGEDAKLDDPSIWEMLFIADAYCGTQDAFYEFARLHNKTIIT
jgi:hypothetical protein